MTAFLHILSIFNSDAPQRFVEKPAAHPRSALFALASRAAGEALPAATKTDKAASVQVKNKNNSAECAKLKAPPGAANEIQGKQLTINK